MFEKVVYDVEATGFLRSNPDVHCLVLLDIDSGRIGAYHDTSLRPCNGTLQEGYKLLYAAKMAVGHNIKSYDEPLIVSKTKQEFHGSQTQIDTCLLSCILFPQMKKNSLEQWAKKLEMEEEKIQNDDWSVLTQTILDRCISDVKLNKELFDHLIGVSTTFAKKHSGVIRLSEALENEQKVSRIHANQVKFGVGYDTRKSIKLLDVLDEVMGRLGEVILEEAPLRCVNAYSVEVKKPFLKEKPADKGVPQPCKMVRDWFNMDENMKDGKRITKLSSVGGPFTRIKFIPLNINSDMQMKDFMLELGWVPTEWNFKKDPAGGFAKDERGRRIKTSPKLTEDSYPSLPEGLGQTIAEYNIAKHRRSLLLSLTNEDNGSLPMALSDERFNPKTGISNVGADAFTCGTPTARYTHVKPVANLPSVDAKWGVQSREIYTIPEGWFRQVGVDLSGIEARKLCHLCYDYPGGKEFAELVLEGDFHSANANTWGVPRRVAKVILYAMMYGAGDAKLGGEAGGNAQLGFQMRAAFMNDNPAYAMLIEELERAYTINGGWIPSIDGRPLYPRTKKDILNTTIQGNCAVVFKRWMIDCNENIEDVVLGLARQMIAYHDETQWAYKVVNDRFSPECFGEKLCKEAALTGERMGLKVPIAAEYKVGMNLAECH